jgi:large conductance mechanosensitive channel
MGMLKEFRDFAMKGNIVDLAVAVIIGGAFGKVIDGLVEGLVMPLISLIVGKPNFTDLSTTISGTVFPYGIFIQALIMFILIALVLFMIIKAMNKVNKKKEEAPAGPSSTDKLLAEIRDALKK